MTNATVLSMLHFAMLRCTVYVHTSTRGSSGCKGIVFHARDLFTGTGGQFRPPPVFGYGETAAFATK